MWHPIIEQGAGEFDVIAVHLPGFGGSPPLPKTQEPTAGHIADVIEWSMNQVGWDTAHVVGNSLGGWLALELGVRRRARSVTALMPAGLWRPGHGSDSRRHRLLFGWWQALANSPGAVRAVRNPLLRTIALAGMQRTMRALAGTRLDRGATITVPVTVVLGSREPLIRRRDLDMAQLPPHAVSPPSAESVTSRPGTTRI